MLQNLLVAFLHLIPIEVRRNAEQQTLTVHAEHRHVAKPHLMFLFRKQSFFDELANRLGPKDAVVALAH